MLGDYEGLHCTQRRLKIRVYSKEIAKLSPYSITNA